MNPASTSAAAGDGEDDGEAAEDHHRTALPHASDGVAEFSDLGSKIALIVL